jgi:hypothetical protein
MRIATMAQCGPRYARLATVAPLALLWVAGCTDLDTRGSDEANDLVEN